MKKLLILIALVLVAGFAYRAYERSHALSPEQQQVAALAEEFERIQKSAGQGARAGAVSGFDTGYSMDKDQADAEDLKKRLTTLKEGLKDGKALAEASQLEGRVEGFLARMKK